MRPTNKNCRISLSRSVLFEEQKLNLFFVLAMQIHLKPSDAFKPSENFLMSSVTRLGYFWKVLATNFVSKVAQKFGDIWGYFVKQLLMENCCSNCFGNFLINGRISMATSGHTADVPPTQVRLEFDIQVALIHVRRHDVDVFKTRSLIGLRILIYFTRGSITVLLNSCFTVINALNVWTNTEDRRNIIIDLLIYYQFLFEYLLPGMIT